MIRAVFFDLDYTLYDMATYLRGAYRDVAQLVADACGEDADVLFDTLWRTWEHVGTDYGFLYNDWLEPRGLFTPECLRLCIDAAHAHTPEITFYPGTEALLNGLAVRYRLGLVSDGHAGMQRRKIHALGLDRWFDPIVLTDALGTSKPDPHVFEYALAKAGVAPDEAVFVGDRPGTDILGARQAGLHTVRVLTGEFCDHPDPAGFPPHVRIASLAELPSVLTGFDAVTLG